MLDLGFNYNEVRASNSQRFKKLRKDEQNLLKDQGYRNTGKEDVRYSQFLLKQITNAKLTPQEESFQRMRSEAINILNQKYFYVEINYVYTLKFDLVLDPEALWAGYDKYTHGLANKRPVSPVEALEEVEEEVEVDAGQTDEEIAAEQAEWDALPEWAKEQIEKLQQEKRELAKANAFLSNQEDNHWDALNKIDDLIAQLRKKEVELSALRSEVRELNDQVADLKDEVELLQSEIQDIENDAECDAEALMREINSKDEVINNLKAQVQELKVESEPIVLDGNISTVNEFAEAVDRVWPRFVN